MSQYKVVVKDSEFEEAAAQFQAYCAVLEETVSQYKQIMNDMADKAASSGAVHDAILCYIEYINKLETIAEGLGGQCSRIVKNFITDIERADDYLYDAGISDIARDFSDEEFEHLVSCLDDPWCDATDSFGDWLVKGFEWLANTFDWEWAKSTLQESRCLLLDYNDTTKQELVAIFNAVKAVDRDYGQSTAGAVPGAGDYDTSNFDCISLCMYAIRDLLEEMAYIIEPRNGSFTVSDIKDRLGGAFAELQKYYDEVVDIKGPNDQPTIPEISDFASQSWASTYFNPFFAPMSDYVADMGGYEAFKMVVFNMFGIAKDKLLIGDYDVYLAKKQMMEVLKEMMENYEYSEGNVDENIDFAEKCLEKMKEYGDGWHEKMDGRTREAKQFKEFLDGLGNAGDILKYGSKGIEYIARLFADYQKGLEVMESFERNYGGDPVLEQAVNEIQSLYKKEFGAWAKEAIDEVEKIGIDEGLKILASKVSVLAVVTAIEEGLDIGGSMLGVGDRAKNMYESLAYFNLANASNQAYREALEKFQTADSNSENYEQLARDLENCFNLNKHNLIELYKSMEKASTGDKQAYYHYCYKQAELLNMHENTQPDILTYEEFLALNT